MKELKVLSGKHYMTHLIIMTWLLCVWFDREVFHQVRPDWHHSYRDSPQSWYTTCFGSPGGPAHIGATKKGDTALTSPQAVAINRTRVKFATDMPPRTGWLWKYPLRFSVGFCLCPDPSFEYFWILFWMLFHAVVSSAKCPQIYLRICRLKVFQGRSLFWKVWHRIRTWHFNLVLLLWAKYFIKWHHVRARASDCLGERCASPKLSHWPQ